MGGDEFLLVLTHVDEKNIQKQIAGEISLSVKTVSTYRSRILEKTGLKTTAELIRYALQSQLVD